jgi:hypothetical protein
MLPGDYTEAVLVSRNLDIPAIMKAGPVTTTDPVLPEDSELALNFLGTIAEKERKLEAAHREVLDLRNRAIEELISTRKDINTTRASIRMILSRQRLYEIRDEQARKAG